VAYVGNQPARGQWRKLSDISSAFDGVITTFTTSVPPGTSQYFVTAGSASQLLISLGGVIQEPDVDYTVSTNSVTFTTPPTSGLSFFGVLCGDALNAGVPSDGSVTTSKLAGGLSVGLTGGSVSTPSLFFTGDDNTGVFSAGADQLNIATNGVERVEFGTSEVVFNDGGANYDFRIEGDTNANLFFVDASAEAVGIGSSTPQALLHLEQTSPADGRLARIVSTGVGAGFLGVKSTGNTFIDANTSSTALEFRTQDTERMRITSGGNVGINKSSPTGRLHVDGSFYVNNIGSGAGTNALKYNTSTGQITYDASSARYKDNIRDVDKGLSEVLQLKSRKFEYKDSGRTDIGFIAEEVIAVVPELVTLDSEGLPEAVNYDRFVSVLTKALQEAVARIETLEAKVAALETP
jgi:hypothetical protein